MKKVFIYSVLLLAVACQKQDAKIAVAAKKPTTCDFLQGNYNNIKRGDLSETSFAGRLRDSDKDGIADNQDNCPKTYNPDQKDSNNNGIGDACETTTSTTATTTVTATSWVLFLDFDGQTVNTPYWNSGAKFICTPSGFTSTEIQNILTEVKNDFSSFKNIVVTTDSTVYFSVTATKRQRMIITENNLWFSGAAGGVAYADSWGWGLEVPGFIFSKALGYSQKQNWEATSHETGHTLGLFHQTLYDANCNFTSEYNPGGNGEAPIMGISYYQPIGRWWIGTSVYGCITTQNDAAIIANKVK